MHKRSKFKFHVYSPAENRTKKESIQVKVNYWQWLTLTKSTTQESYEDRLRQQQLLLEVATIHDTV